MVIKMCVIGRMSCIANVTECTRATQTKKTSAMYDLANVAYTNLNQMRSILARARAIDLSKKYDGIYKKERTTTHHDDILEGL